MVQSHKWSSGEPSQLHQYDKTPVVYGLVPPFFYTWIRLELTNDPPLALTHIAFARVQILHRVSLAKPGDTDVDARWGRGAVRQVVVDQPKSTDGEEK